MGADCAHRIKTLLQPHYKNAEARIQRHRVNRIVLRLAYAHNRRGFVQNTGGQILQTEDASAQPPTASEPAPNFTKNWRRFKSCASLGRSVSCLPSAMFSSISAYATSPM